RPTPPPAPGGAGRTLRLDLEYEGTRFAGWAAQPGLRTVEGELAGALGRILGAPVALRVAGRTDAGVHATGQVASAVTASDRDPRHPRLPSVHAHADRARLLRPDRAGRRLGAAGRRAGVRDRGGRLPAAHGPGARRLHAARGPRPLAARALRAPARRRAAHP